MNYHFEEGTFDGLACVTLYTGRMRLVLVTGAGPRIAYLGAGLRRRTSCTGRRTVWFGGREPGLGGPHRVWLTRPMADESEDTYAGDCEPCRVDREEDGVTVTAPPHPFTRLERGIRVRVLGETSFEVANFIKNTGPLVYSGGVWSPTCVNPKGRTFYVPLGDEGASWDMVRIVVPRVFAGNVTQVEDPQVTFEGNDMVVRSMGRVTKRCVGAPKGEVSMLWPEEKLKFTKKAEYVRDGITHWRLQCGCVYRGKRLDGRDGDLWGGTDGEAGRDHMEQGGVDGSGGLREYLHKSVFQFH